MAPGFYLPAKAPSAYIMSDVKDGVILHFTSCKQRKRKPLLACGSVHFCDRMKAMNLNLRRRTHMKYKGTLIVVKDCNRALKFYSDMFGFQLLQDNDGNMELTNNLYLQESGYWEQFTKRSVIPNSNQSELYFEEPNIEQFVERLETLYPEIEYVNHLMTHSWGQKVVRFYDLDGNLIEVGTPI